MLHFKEKIFLIIVLTSFSRHNQQYAIVEGTVSELMSPSGCVCPGDQLVLECSVQGGVATQWHGSAFDCISNSIILLHGRFSNQQPTGGECNDGKIVAHSIGEFNNTYISQLTVSVTEDMNNKTIECAADTGNGALSSFGASTITVATDSISSIDGIRLTEVSRGQLKFEWLSDNNLCPTHYAYAITSSNCGDCPRITANKSAVCDVLNNHKAQTCAFAVQILVCGNLFGNASAQSITAIIKVPDPPEFTSSPNYQGGKLTTIRTTWIHNTSLEFNITDGITGSLISYTVIYSDSHSNNSCGLSTILVPSCERSICSHLFQVSASSCSPSSNINVSMFATNVIGDGPLSRPVYVMIASGLPSNEFQIPGFVPYVATIGGLAALLLILCIFFVIFTWLRTKKNKPVAREEFKFAEGPSIIEPKVEDTVYEEIDELQQNPQTIHISKNMAYCQFHGMQTPKGNMERNKELN